MQDTREDLVLGIVQGYTWSQIEPFVVSLRATGYNGHICLMYRGMTAEALSRLEAAEIELVPFRLATVRVFGRRRSVSNALIKLHRSWLGKNDLVPRVSRAGLELAACWSRDPRKTKARIIQYVLNINLMRFCVWYLYLTRRHTDFRRVMLADVRDVLFQRNPFDFPFDGALCTFLEDRGMTIGTDPHTGPLVRGKYGPEALHSIESQPVACSGVTFGSTVAILHYLGCMIDESTNLVDHKNQGIHNVLLYRGAFDPVHIFGNEAGPVMNLSQVAFTQLRFNRDGWLVNAQDSVVNVLHEYDRHLGRNGIRLERTGGTFRLIPETRACNSSN